MTVLEADLRRGLERTVIAARDRGEAAAEAALTTLAVWRDDFYPAMTGPQRALRRALRAQARQLGEGDLEAGKAALREEIAYERWHRLLFARFLAENALLWHPEIGAPITLAECAELAPEEGAANGWELAARYAAEMLPGIFAADDPAAQVRLAPEDHQALERLVQDLPADVFTAHDALGWVYQFWQTRRKKEVRDSQGKIGAAELPAVTQFFTEDYMVRFLLENTLGAWWAACRPDSPLIKDWPYLRWREDGQPAAGVFAGWPQRVAELTVLDPCCGSGHFLVASFEMLWRMRAEEEGLSPAAAGEAVLRDNLHGLEIDPRCTQIAAFALLLAAWKAGGYRPLPLPQVACSGIAVAGQLDDWLKLANGSQRLRGALERLYGLFRQAPTLGSLIDPTHLPIEERMFSADYEAVAPFLARALTAERNLADPVAALLGHAAEGVARAAGLLARRYTLVTTNVPYLASGKQCEALKTYTDLRYPLAADDLATAFVERCRAYATEGGSYALVTPQNWTFLGSYAELRMKLLRQQSWNVVCQLGSGAQSTSSWEVLRTLSIITNSVPNEDQQITGLDAPLPSPQEKEARIRGCELEYSHQIEQLRNPDARIALRPASTGRLLSEYAVGVHGLTTGDLPRMRREFWEFRDVPGAWVSFQSTVGDTIEYGGRTGLLFWNCGSGPITQLPGARMDGRYAWGKAGVVISQMRQLPCTLYTGTAFDNNTAVILPHDPAHLPAIWCYCSSPEYARDVRRIDRKLNVTNATLVKVPFDLERWQQVADERYPDGLPAPHSNDPTQWLFGGQPAGASAPLQVAVARLLAYRWPQQGVAGGASDGLAALADSDGIVPLVAVGGERPAVERLRGLLAAAYGADWSPARQAQLLADVGADSLEGWLRDGFFAQHCKLFGNRPFIWHVWDGRKDGFGALINYHRLDGPTLDKLTYTYLGRWIEAQRAEQGRGVAGADGRLVAALELQKKLVAIRQGEPPYDIYVRWKPLAEQPLGWAPDLNDGVRLNIRPWVTAGVLRARFTINWNKDRGKDPDGGERVNDLHYTRAEKSKAREEAERQNQGVVS